MTEADRLREYVSELSNLRHLCVLREVREQKSGNADMARFFCSLEEHMVMLEDKIAASADRLDPPPFRPTGQQWLAGITRRAGV